MPLRLRPARGSGPVDRGSPTGEEHTADPQEEDQDAERLPTIALPDQDPDSQDLKGPVQSDG